MNESEPKNEKTEEERRLDPELLKKGLRCDLDQYEMLKRCSDKKDMTEWNQWWRKNRDKKEVWLEGANFDKCYLSRVNFNRHSGSTIEVHLEDSTLRNANLEYAKFWSAHLERVHLNKALLKGANLQSAYLRGSIFWHVDLRNTNMRKAIVDGETLFWKGKINRATDFRGVALDSVRINPAIKQLLEHNIRRKNWGNWYKKHSLLRWPVWLFWLISDYGLRTWRIIGTFFGLAIVFTTAYWLCPSCVMVNGTVGDIRGLWHALYFSVVTMTTLGFGDIAANPDSWTGQTLLMIQVILGYVLLGALVTRFAVLFTAGGPAGKFADDEQLTNK